MSGDNRQLPMEDDPVFLTETKPTYAELERGNKELEKRIYDLNRAGEHLQKSHKEMELLVEDRTADLREALQMLKRERRKRSRAIKTCPR